MGKTRTPKHRVVLQGQQSSCWWPKVHGKPTAANLRAYLEGFSRSLLPGGCNAHLTRIGVRCATSARIEENCTGGEVVCEVSL